MSSPHPESRWTHPICAPCYMREEPNRGKPVVMTYQPDEPLEHCCFCGRATASGIYYRKDPKLVHTVIDHNA